MKLAATACLCALALGCNERDRAAPAPAAAAIPRPDHMLGGAVVPQAHDFPAGRTDDIRRLFDRGAMSYPISVVSAQGAQTQFVNPKPVFVSPTRFVVGAPPEQHAAMDRMIASLEKGSQPSSTYEVTYWLVEATPAPKTEIAGDLGEVAPMLEKLASLGTRRFRALDRVSTRAIDEVETKVSGQMIRIEQELAPASKGIDLELQMSLRTEGGPSVETRLEVPLDQPIVFGDSTQAGAGPSPNLLLYVVRARRVD